MTKYLITISVFCCTLAGFLSAQQGVPVPVMVFVEGGTFWQGSKEAPYTSNERVHRTTLSSFYISQTEVTQELWTAVMGTNPSRFPGKDRPVENVSWLEAVKFCNALSERHGYTPAYTISGSNVEWNREANGYRLPTEAEWEYAARGGIKGAIAEEPLTRSPYAGGFDINQLSWYDANSGKASKPVATKAANELGLYDMSGNVWEWCWDWYGEYPSGEVTNPTGPEKPTGYRVLRGGAWFTPAKLTRTTYRYWNTPTFKSNSVGFRLARNANEDIQLSLPPELSVDPYQILSAPVKHP